MKLEKKRKRNKTLFHMIVNSRITASFSLYCTNK